MVGILYKFLCFLFPLACSSRIPNEDIRFTNCGPKNSTVSVNVSPCPSQPCTFHHGANVSVTINFYASESAGTLQTKVYGIVEGVPVPYPLPNPNACQDCNIKCPVTQGGSYTYKSGFKILSEYPNIKLAVKWTIVDASENQLICFVFPMQIQN